MEQRPHHINQPQTNQVDLLEIYHARQLRDQILAQLRRIRASSDHAPLLGVNNRRDVRGYYEALLLTVAELLHEMGDDDIGASA